MVISCGSTEIIEWIMSKCSKTICFLSYDTTFSLGDFYVSALVIKIPTFNEKPTIPVAFLIHSRKFQRMHENFFVDLQLRYFSLQCIIVTDGESALENAVTKVFPKWTPVTCWNHIIQDVERWVKNHGGKKDDCVIYKGHIRELLNCQTKDLFDMKIATLKPSWSQAFSEYVDTYLNARLQRACNYYLHSIGLNDDIMTTNMSESFNAILKRFQDWKEESPDVMVYSLYKLQSVYLSDIESSLEGFGPYSMCENGSRAQNPLAKQVVKVRSTPDSIVDDLRKSLFGYSSYYQNFG